MYKLKQNGEEYVFATFYEALAHLAKDLIDELDWEHLGGLVDLINTGEYDDFDEASRVQFLEEFYDEVSHE